MLKLSSILKPIIHDSTGSLLAINKDELNSWLHSNYVKATNSSSFSPFENFKITQEETFEQCGLWVFQ